MAGKRSYLIFSWVILLTFLGLVFIKYHSLLSQQINELVAILNDPRLLAIYLRTLIIAFSTAGASMLLGLVLTYFLFEIRLPGAGLIRSIYYWPLILPPYFLATAWLSWLGEFGILKDAGLLPNGETGCVFLLTLYLLPLVIIAVANNLQNTNAEAKEAALLLGGYRKYLWRVWLPQVIPAALGGGLLILVMAANNYSIPAILGVNTLSTEIYAEFGAFYNYQHAFLKILPLFVFLLLLIFLFRRKLSQAFMNLQLKRRNNLQTSHQGLSLLGWFAWFSYLAAALILPVTGLIIQTKSVANLIKAIGLAASELWFGFWFSGLVGFLLASLGLVLAYCYLRQRRVVIAAAMVGLLLLPAVFTGISLIYLLNRPALNFIYNGGGLLLVGYLARFLPLVFIILVPALQAIPKDLEEAAWLTGRDHLTAWRRVLLPLALPAFLSAWMVGFFFCFGEAESSILLYPPGLETISVRILSLLHYGASPIVNGLVLLQVIILGLTALVSQGIYHSLQRGKLNG